MPGPGTAGRLPTPRDQDRSRLIRLHTFATSTLTPPYQSTADVVHSPRPREYGRTHQALWASGSSTFSPRPGKPVGLRTNREPTSFASATVLQRSKARRGARHVRAERTTSDG